MNRIRKKVKQQLPNIVRCHINIGKTINLMIRRQIPSMKVFDGDREMVKNEGFKYQLYPYISNIISGFLRYLQDIVLILLIFLTLLIQYTF